MSFRTLVHGNDPITIQFKGAMTEDADLSLLRLSPNAALELDLTELTSINSIGIREFRNWSLKLDNRNMKVIFAPKCFIDQVNMVPDLLPRWATIESFYVPYYSEQSGEESRVLFTAGQEFVIDGAQVQMRLPDVKDSKGNVMEPDVVTENYFGFINRRG